MGSRLVTSSVSFVAASLAQPAPKRLARPGSVDRRAIDRAWSLGGLVHVARSERRVASRVKGRVVVKLDVKERPPWFSLLTR